MLSPETRPPADPPALFGAWGLVFLLAVTLVAARFAAPWVALLAGSLLLVGVLARLWARYALTALTYQRHGLSLSPEGELRISDNAFRLSGWPSAGPRGRDARATFSASPSPTAKAQAASRKPPSLGAPPSIVRAFCGDTVLLETRLGNRKLLPLPWVEAWERLPLALDPGGDLVESVEALDQAWLCQGASLWPYQRARWQHRLACRRRGAYTLGAVRVRAGDPFGLGERERILPGRLDVIVYPRVVPLRRLALPLRHPLLDAASRRSLVTDPTRTAWVRDYQPGDPPRLIHWPATAHRGALQVRVPEPATSLQVSLVLDPASFDLVLRLYRDTLFELAVSALASLAVYLHQAGCAVGLYTTTQAETAVAPSASPGQLEALLERLARVEPCRAPDRPAAPVPRPPRGSAVALAVSDLALDLPTTVARLEQAGHPFAVLLATAGDRPVALPPERVVRLSPDADLAAALEGAAAPIPYARDTPARRPATECAPSAPQRARKRQAGVGP